MLNELYLQLTCIETNSLIQWTELRMLKFLKCKNVALGYQLYYKKVTKKLHFDVILKIYCRRFLITYVYIVLKIFSK